MKEQEQCNWCWAAVAASISSFMPLPPGMPAPLSQCQVASEVIGSDCCNDGHALYGCPNSPCNQPELVENALNRIGHYGGSNSDVPDQTTVTGQIDGNCPIVGKIQWNDAQPQNHYVLIVGYTTDSSGVFALLIADPSDPTGTISQSYSRDELASGGYRQYGQWIGTYFTA